jgi:hypothetical protein
MSFTNYLETEILDWAFTTGTATRPTAWHIGLFTAAPGETGGGTEISTSGTGYGRQAATFSVSGDTATTTAAIEWGTASTSWGTITHVAVFDAATSGNMLAYAALTTAKTIGAGDVFRIPAGDLDITLN